jgi:hypothetical protein
VSVTRPDPHDIRPGDTVRDNDFREHGAKYRVHAVSENVVVIDRVTRHTRVSRQRVWSDGKERRGGYSLVDSSGQLKSRANNNEGGQGGHDDFNGA